MCKCKTISNLQIKAVDYNADWVQKLTTQTSLDMYLHAGILRPNIQQRRIHKPVEHLRWSF